MTLGRVVVACTVGVQEFVLEFNGRVEYRMVGDAEISEHRFVGRLNQRVVIQRVDMLYFHRVDVFMCSPEDVGERVFRKFVLGIGEIRRKREFSGRVDFEAAAVAERMNLYSVRVCLEIPNRKVECVE